MPDFETPGSENAALLQNILGADNPFGAPGSPNAAILQNILGANNVLREPQSEIESLLMQILEQGGGGFTPYYTSKSFHISTTAVALTQEEYDTFVGAGADMIIANIDVGGEADVKAFATSGSSSGTQNNISFSDDRFQAFLAPKTTFSVALKKSGQTIALSGTLYVNGTTYTEADIVFEFYKII